ncbi:recombinase family protein [Neobacillus sp. CF12]|uniref:recombinase family protein n=1 Tax=Neobacillus sp. CF12 TaxID=3055864 RepID=UPI0025A0D847|nr:recombinase family protein [Neobacillus sp. CF12]MDM5326830.1 recombinase family protein [Neobacillus sp. CF12]
MKLGYARVSTLEQSLELQHDALIREGVEKEYIFEEKVTGTKADRPKLQELLKFARKGDQIVVYKLDRLSRSTKHLIELSEELDKRGIELISIQDKIDTTTAIGKAMFRMLAVLCEMERDIISERTKAGLEAARTRGRNGGRPGVDNNKLEHAFYLYDLKKYKIKQITDRTGVSKATLYKKLKEREEIKRW